MKEYVRSIYNIIVPYDGIFLLYNELTKATATLNNMKEYRPNEWLVMNYFFVPKDKDQTTMFDEFRVANNQRTTQSDPNNIMILPTLKCNAHCFYCFEDNYENKVDMTMETANKVCDWVLKHTVRDFTIKWFGGEPLMNTDVIDHICDRLAEESVYFDWHSEMTTNGYLFKNITDEQIYKWRLHRVDISLDGSKDIYNKTKRYDDDDPDPFQTVMDNLTRLSDMGVNERISLNVSPTNYDSLVELVQYFQDNMTHIKAVLLVKPLYETDGLKFTNLQFVKMYNDYIKLKKITDKLPIFRFKEFEEVNRISIYHCMADHGESVAIDPQGNIYACEKCTDNTKLGNVESDEIDKDTIARCKEYVLQRDKCKTCILKPSCLSLKVCNGEKQCTDEYMNSRMEKLKEEIIEWYQKYGNNSYKDYRGQQW